MYIRKKFRVEMMIYDLRVTVNYYPLNKHAEISNVKHIVRLQYL